MYGGGSLALGVQGTLCLSKNPDDPAFCGAQRGGWRKCNRGARTGLRSRSSGKSLMQVHSGAFCISLLIDGHAERLLRRQNTDTVGYGCHRGAELRYQRSCPRRLKEHWLIGQAQPVWAGLEQQVANGPCDFCRAKHGRREGH